jgi:hypothetical protein
MELLCPSCEKKLLLKLLPDPYCALWCGSCDQEVPPESLTDAGVPKELAAEAQAWGAKARDILGTDEDDAEVGGDLPDAEYVRSWRRLCEETADLLHRLRKFVPAGTNAFGAPKPPDWPDAEILKWRKARQREGLLHLYGFQLGARYVEQEGGVPLDDGASLPVPYPNLCVTKVEKDRFREGFILGTRTGVFDGSMYTEILARLRGDR